MDSLSLRNRTTPRTGGAFCSSDPCKTKIFVTGTARTLTHFLELRGGLHNNTGICLLAAEMWRLLKREPPSFFRDVELVDEPDSPPPVRALHSRVSRRIALPQRRRNRCAVKVVV